MSTTAGFWPVATEYTDERGEGSQDDAAAQAGALRRIAAICGSSRRRMTWA